MILKTQNVKFLPCDWLVFTGGITDIKVLERGDLKSLNDTKNSKCQIFTL